jgi:hypothetical protein
MRQMFSSPRLTNVEGVAQLLNEAGIETKITQDRSYKKVSRREFSFRGQPADAGNQPAVWVIKPEDYFQARQILHDAGLLDAKPADSYIPEALTFRDRADADPQKRISRLRLVLLFVIGTMAAAMAVRMLFQH